MNIVEFVGRDHALRLFGIRLIGFDASTLRKLGLSIGFIVAVMIIAAALRP